MATTKISPGMLKTLTRGSSAPVRFRYTLLRRPAFGPASMTQANAPRKGGVTNEAMMRPRMSRFPGRSVRAESQAMGTPMASEASPTQNARITVFHSAFWKCESVNTFR
jgi:hypothetical protein